MINKIVSVIGLGYVGLPSAITFASVGYQTIGVDVNANVVESVNEGKPHITEPGLSEALKDVIQKKRLKSVMAPEPADIYIICVPTPFDTETKTPDTRFVFDALASILDLLKFGDVVIIESTCPVGTTEKAFAKICKGRPDLYDQRNARLNVHLAYCPERILPGNVFEELVNNSRVIGGITKECGSAAASFYKYFVKGEIVVASSAKTAELAKLTENAFRDVNIAFANELANIADEINVPVWELIDICNLHPRVNILDPGPGVGGHCIAVDPWFIVSESPNNTELIRTARKINDNRPYKFFDKIKFLLDNLSKTNPSQSTIIFYGITYKPDIDDLRESPALKVVRLCMEKLINVQFKIVEPNLTYLPIEFRIIEKISLEQNINADIHVMLVDHKEFKGMEIPSGHLIDARGAWKPKR